MWTNQIEDVVIGYRIPGYMYVLFATTGRLDHLFSCVLTDQIGRAGGNPIEFRTVLCGGVLIFVDCDWQPGNN